MGTVSNRFTLESLSRLLGGAAEGPMDTPLARPVAAGANDPAGVTFAENERFLKLAEESEIGAIIIGKEMRSAIKPAIRVEQPRLAFFRLLTIFQREIPLAKGIHPTAIVDPEAVVDPEASVGPYVVVEGGANIAAGAKVYPFCYIGEDCTLGRGAILYPHVVLYRDVTIGDGAILHSGAIVGAEGFGYEWTGKERLKVPQVGAVEIGPDVEIGANTAIDRATMGTTRIGEGTKLDNLVQIAHNVEIGDHCVIAAQSGISGSTTIGNRVMMGGNVGTTDHVTIADDVALGGRSSVDRDITEAGAYFGTPSRPIGEAKRSMLLYARLPELVSRLREAERKIKDLEKRLS